MLKNKRKIINTAIIFGITALLISVATYAWFISLRTVNITSFDMKIASTESILISVDGKNWSNEVTINEENHDKLFEGHTNSWGGKGLIPMSSTGKANVSTSRMILYEKASMTATSGGFRLMASRVNNDGAYEKPGYVAFDLFIKNFSGKAYYKDINYLDEEALYLTIDSEVETAKSGTPGAGIENSVRIAFMQIGRLIASIEDQNTITSIACKNTDLVTSICRDAVIWEPNDKAHTQGAISWYNTTCRRRTGSDVRSSGSYSGSCNKIEDGKYYPTYSVNNTIGSNHNVDVYDGSAYNRYTNSTRLSSVNTFTDTMRDLTGTDRKEIFTLAPNSITKIRVYIYLEGQDIDNYDFAAVGKRLSIQFGFTKERFSSTDFFYESGEAGTDDWPPVITITPDVREIIVPRGSTFIPPNATAIDKTAEFPDGSPLIDDITRRIQVTNPVNTNIPGEYYVRYNVSDWAGNYAEEIVVKVIVE